MANPLQQALQRNYMQDMLDKKYQSVRPTLGHLSMYIGLVTYAGIGGYVSIVSYSYLLLLKKLIARSGVSYVDEL